MTKTAVTTLPSQIAFYHAILRHLALRPDGDRREAIYEAIPDLLDLTDAQRAERLANLSHLRYRHRTGWGLSMLKSAGLLDAPTRGVWTITSAGKELLQNHPSGFDDESGRRLMRAARMRNAGEQADEEDDDVPSVEAVQQSPEERIDSAARELSSTVAAELLDRALKMPPAAFEDLVLDVLLAMGYGASRDDLQRVGGSGDGGIDGIITLDRLGFEKVYVQAKRWQGSVGRPEIQAFFGALAGRRAKKGVFITTSTFTRDARDFEAHVPDAIVLIDGRRLAQLMIDFGVGVTHRSVTLPKVDGDYFEDE